MNFPLLPVWVTETVTDVEPSFFQKHGYQLVMLDFDNTLLPYTTNKPEQAVVNWLDRLKGEGLKVCIVSNSHKPRVPDFCREYGIDCITGARKPFPSGIRQCLAHYDIPSERAVLIGDQIYTDTLGGNCAGVDTILVRSIDNHNFWLKLRHMAERPFIFFARKRRISS